MGATMLADVDAGMFANVGEVFALRGEADYFTPRMGEDEQRQRLAGWPHAVDKVVEWAGERTRR